ncbi:MAG: sulfur carrier protein ThiS [Oligoflexales bacterium]|nr:sulfur carrier protein ThiS [Oligoflexales bacterium]
MEIILNSQATSIEPNTNIEKLLEDFKFQKQYVAVALNFECVQRDKYLQTILSEGDEVEILSPMQGG